MTIDTNDWERTWVRMSYINSHFIFREWKKLFAHSHALSRFLFVQLLMKKVVELPAIILIQGTLFSSPIHLIFMDLFIGKFFLTSLKPKLNSHSKWLNSLELWLWWWCWESFFVIHTTYTFNENTCHHLYFPHFMYICSNFHASKRRKSTR